MTTLLARGSDSRDHRRGVLAGRLTTEEVLAIMVHDLRSPLAAIQMALEVVRLSHTENSEVERAFGVMERQVGDLARLIGDLLDLTRVTKGKIKLRAEWVDLSAVIDHAVEACHPLITQKRHQLTVSLPPEPTRVRADGPRLQQVLINLLNNAAKYTDLGGHIWLTAEAAPGTQIVRVRDNGRGIAPDLLPRIFDLFQQGPENQGLGGLGIGLALVKWLVELHGGTVCAHSDGLDKGSEFVVRLHAPVIRVQSQKSEIKDQEVGDQGSKFSIAEPDR